MHVLITGAAGMVGRKLAERLARQGSCAGKAIGKPIVAGWPARFDAKRALALGFTAERDFDEIIRVHIEDDLGGHLPN